MVQTRDLAEYPSGRQTRVEIGGEADIGGVRRNVAPAGCSFLFEIHGHRHRRRHALSTFAKVAASSPFSSAAIGRRHNIGRKSPRCCGAILREEPMCQGYQAGVMLSRRSFGLLAVSAAAL